MGRPGLVSLNSMLSKSCSVMKKSSRLCASYWARAVLVTGVNRVASAIYIISSSKEHCCCCCGLVAVVADDLVAMVCSAV